MRRRKMLQLDIIHPLTGYLGVAWEKIFHRAVGESPVAGDDICEEQAARIKTPALAFQGGEELL